MEKTYVGIDIGKSGAIAILYPDSNIKVMRMPMINTEIDYSDLYNIIAQCSAMNCHITFEQLGVIYGSAKSTAFSMGHQLGAIEMACIAAKTPYTKVRAVDWQKEMFKGVDEVTKNGTSKRDTKAMAYIAIKRLFPQLELKFTPRASIPHDGLVDAVLIAEYTRRKNL